jgi:hypothetical protein
MPDDGREPDELVGDLRPAHEGVLGGDETVVLVGYFGDGPGETYRVYVDQQLREYIQVPADAVVYRKHLDEPDTYAARSAVWIKASVMEAAIDYDGHTDVLTDRGIGKRLPKNLLDAAYDITIQFRRPYTGMNCTVRCGTPERTDLALRP